MLNNSSNDFEPGSTWTLTVDVLIDPVAPALYPLPVDSTPSFAAVVKLYK